MKAELRFNICDLTSSFILNNDNDGLEDRIGAHILPHISYACIFWAQHLCNVPYVPGLIRDLSNFLYSHLLYWLEVLSLLKKVNTAGHALFTVMKWIGVSRSLSREP